MIRWIVRLLCLGILLFGLLLAVVYPLALRDEAGREAGSWQVHAPETGFGRFEVERALLPASVEIHVDMTVNGPFEPREDVSVMSLVAWADGTMILAAPLYFTQPSDHPENGREAGAAYRDFAGVIDPVDAERYLFEMMPGEAEGLDIATVDVTLKAAASEPDPAALWVGYVATALGLLGLALTFRRRARRPAAPRWGRG